MTNVLKLGGGAGVDRDSVLGNLAARARAGERWVLVHGVSAAANALAEQVGYPPRTLTTPSGHTSRYTDARTLEIFSAAVGSVNQQLTAALIRGGARAVGLSGPNVLRAERHRAIRAVRDGRQFVVRDDYSGTIIGVDGDLLRTLLDAGCLPVVGPLALGTEYERLNVDGDLAAAHIARAVGAETLIILSNVPGLLRDVNDPSTLVTDFSIGELPRYADFAAGRMKKKLLAAETALADHSPVARVIVADSRLRSPLDAALAGAGTHITRSTAYAHA